MDRITCNQYFNVDGGDDIWGVKSLQKFPNLTSRSLGYFTWGYGL